MASITQQRDLVITLKKETLSNVGILSKLHPMPAELYRQIFKDNVLEKPTQTVFNYLSHYLVNIIDSQASAALPWPLYDTKTERTYRNELSILIADYSSKGLVAPVISSYLVNPGCFKVTYLIFQLSQLAVQRVLVTKMVREQKKKLYESMAEQYKSQNVENFIECIEEETEIMCSKFSNYLCKRQVMEKIAKLFRDRITKIEDTLLASNAQGCIDKIVDGFLATHNVNKEKKEKFLGIKNVYEHSRIFDSWLLVADEQITNLEIEWETKMTPFLNLCQETYKNSEALIARQTGETPKHDFTVEYNSKTDDICTKDLQNQVNSQQKYILKNIIKDDKLNFPNLIRSFLISICYILKNAEIGNEICMFNEYLSGGMRSYGEIVTSMKILVERVLNAEARLQPQQDLSILSLSMKETSEIPPLPDLSELKMNRDFHPQILFDTFTPLNHNKHQFNLRKKVSNSFTKPLPKSFLITPFHHAPREDFFKSVMSCRGSAFNQPNVTQNFNNVSMISQVSQATSKGNETIAECNSGFTKQQICRLLSTKKTSSSKKFKHQSNRPNIHFKKGALFNESILSNESQVIFRSHSSPNLYENKDKKSQGRSRKLSIMKEDSPSLLEVSGIAALERDSNHSTPQGAINLESTRKLIDASSLPSIATPPLETRDNSKNVEIDLNKEIENLSIELELQRKSTALEEEIKKIETPKANAQLIKKTSSLEKIINRFKKVRASVIPSEAMNQQDDFKTILEERENLNTVNIDVFTANKVLLPDLLSPSCSLLKKSNDYNELWFENEEEKVDKPKRKPRESLGAALGVDHTFLDQFDLID